MIDVNDQNPSFTQQIYEFDGAKEAGAMIGKVQVRPSYLFSYIHRVDQGIDQTLIRLPGPMSRCSNL